MSIQASGTQAATIGTKHSLSAPTSMGVYTLLVDTNDMQAGDTLELSLETKFTALGSLRTVYVVTYNNAQTTEPAKVMMPVNTGYGCTVSLKQTAGTGRSFPWMLLVN